MSARRLLVLFRHLPEDSAVVRAMGTWTDSMGLQVAILEHLDLVARLIWSGFSGGRKAPWEPLHIPRPREPRTGQRLSSGKREATAEELATILQLPLPGRG